MANVSAPVSVQTGKTRGPKMIEAPNLNLSEIHIFEISNRPKLAELSTDDFNNQFKDFTDLLVHFGKNGEEVVAASTVSDRAKLVQLYCEKFSLAEDDLSDYGFELGAKALIDSSKFTEGL